MHTPVIAALRARLHQLLLQEMSRKQRAQHWLGMGKVLMFTLLVIAASRNNVTFAVIA